MNTTSRPNFINTICMYYQKNCT